MIRESVNPNAYGPGADIGVTFKDEASGQLKNVHLENVATLRAQFAKLVTDEREADDDRNAAMEAALKEINRSHASALSIIAERRKRLEADAFSLAEQKLARDAAIEAALPK